MRLDASQRPLCSISVALYAAPMARRTKTTQKHQQDALSLLEHHWGDAYKISCSDGIFRAERRDDSQVVSADTPELLTERIRQNYDERPVPREFSLPGGEEYDDDDLDAFGRMNPSPQNVAKSPSFRQLQAFEDAICYRSARLAEPCPGCGPDGESRCDEHACDVMLIAGYRQAVKELSASMRAEPQHFLRTGTVHYLPGHSPSP
jgi:hypothetical protein